MARESASGGVSDAAMARESGSGGVSDAAIQRESHKVTFCLTELLSTQSYFSTVKTDGTKCSGNSVPHYTALPHYKMSCGACYEGVLRFVYGKILILNIIWREFSLQAISQTIQFHNGAVKDRVSSLLPAFVRNAKLGAVGRQ
jgi:hypothetical protein